MEKIHHHRTLLEAPLDSPPERVSGALRQAVIRVRLPNVRDRTLLSVDAIVPTLRPARHDERDGLRPLRICSAPPLSVVAEAGGCVASPAHARRRGLGFLAPAEAHAHCDERERDPDDHRASPGADRLQSGSGEIPDEIEDDPKAGESGHCECTMGTRAGHGE